MLELSLVLTEYFFIHSVCVVTHILGFTVRVADVVDVLVLDRMAFLFVVLSARIDSQPCQMYICERGCARGGGSG